MTAQERPQPLQHARDPVGEDQQQSHRDQRIGRGEPEARRSRGGDGERAERADEPCRLAPVERRELARCASSARSTTPAERGGRDQRERKRSPCGGSVHIAAQREQRHPRIARAAPSSHQLQMKEREHDVGREPGRETHLDGGRDRGLVEAEPSSVALAEEVLARRRPSGGTARAR